MKRRLAILLLVAGSCVAGVACAQFVYHSPSCRDGIGVFCGRGHLLALALSEGIYETDLQRVLAEARDAAGADEQDRHDENMEKPLFLRHLIATAMSGSFAARERISNDKIERAATLLRCQFRDDKAWKAALRSSCLSARSLRRIIADNLRTRQWISRQIHSRLDITDEECRSFYDRHRENFLQPVRLRASHLFLAAPPETQADVVEAKRVAIELAFTRLAHGEDFSELAASISEDEATKLRGGDLGYFSALRMPSDFFAETAKLRPQQTSPPIRTRLGFHIVKLTDSKPARQMPLDEARVEIAAALESQKRQAVLEKLIVDLSAQAEWRRPLP
ncbi:MAG TPA: peptidyl-prolyl cis-trans isomerase [Chthoniobacterales bacterium]|nr:peptidyl-prolyl cis-trans isomerase [Chthoniobacterales bacterium]